MSQIIGNRTIVILNLFNSDSHGIQQMDSETQSCLGELDCLVNATNGYVQISKIASTYQVIGL